MSLKSNESGMVSAIQRFCVNDGPGIRTTVFLKGCPLDCKWCHNPETKSHMKEIMYDASRCAECRACQAVCPRNCHSFRGSHIYDRDNCSVCGRCTEVCMTQAVRAVGETYTAEEITAVLLKDRMFYDYSGGGATISGGEPLAQFSFTEAVLRDAKENGIHTCLETCGYASEQQISAVAPYVDIFLYDFKESDPDLHMQYTGVSNERILNNLRLLDLRGSKIILRCPVIPGFNDRDSHFRSIAELADSLKNIIRIDIEPYHPLGIGKSEMLGVDYPLSGIGFPTEEAVYNWISTIGEQTSVPVTKA